MKVLKWLILASEQASVLTAIELVLGPGCAAILPDGIIINAILAIIPRSTLGETDQKQGSIQGQKCRFSKKSTETDDNHAKKEIVRYGFSAN